MASYALYLLLGAGAVGMIVFFVRRGQKERQERDRTRRQALSSAGVTNDITRVGPNGVLKLPPFGTNRTPIETYVIERHRYEDGGNPWYELVCQHGTRDLLVEWERDGRHLEVTAGYEDENPTLRDLGLTPDDLEAIDEQEEGSFEWDGIVWQYEDSNEVAYYQGDGQDSEDFYVWEFCDEEETRYVTIEKWPGERRYTVYHLWTLNSERIEVFSAGDGAM